MRSSELPALLFIPLILVKGVLAPLTEPVGVDVGGELSPVGPAPAFFLAAFSARRFCFEDERGGILTVAEIDGNYRNFFQWSVGVSKWIATTSLLTTFESGAFLTSFNIRTRVLLSQHHSWRLLRILWITLSETLSISTLQLRSSTSIIEYAGQMKKKLWLDNATNFMYLSR